MVAVLVVTQGSLGRALAESARTIAGEDLPVKVLELSWDMTAEQAREAVAAAAREADEGRGVVLAADLYGGTPCNAAFAAARERPEAVEAVAGLNLPMLVALGRLSRKAKSPGELARAAVERGLKSMRVAGGGGAQEKS